MFHNYNSFSEVWSCILTALRYVPSLGFKIHQENKKKNHPANWTRINLGKYQYLRDTKQYNAEKNIFWFRDKRYSNLEINTVSSAGVGMGNGWMSPLDQGKYASYLFFHGLLDKAQYEQLDEIGKVFYKSANCDPHCSHQTLNQNQWKGM